jgi:hypothetical protein
VSRKKLVTRERERERELTGCTIGLSDKRTAVRTEVAAAQQSAFSPYTAEDAWLSDAPTGSSARITVIAIYNNAAEKCAVHGTKKERKQREGEVMTLALDVAETPGFVYPVRTIFGGVAGSLFVLICSGLSRRDAPDAEKGLASFRLACTSHSRVRGPRDFLSW